MAINATTYRGAPTYTPGKFGNALSGGVLGVANGIDFFAEGAGANLDGTITLEAWAKIDAAPGATKVIAGRDSVLWFGVNGQGQVIANVGGGAGQYQMGTGATISDGAWHHVAVVINAGQGSVYVDGIRKANVATVAVRNPTAVYDGLWIGGYGATGTGFDWPGQVDEVAISTTAQYVVDFAPPTSPFANTRPGQVNVYHMEADGTDSDTGDVTPPNLVTIPQTSAGFAYSPYTWDVTADHALSINGGYVRTLITGAPSIIELNFDVSNVPASVAQRSQIAYRLDAQNWVTLTPSAVVPVTIPAETSAWNRHTLEIVVKSTTENQNRWNAPYLTGIKFKGLNLSVGAGVTAPELRQLKGICFGDSITEGIGVISNIGDTVARSDARLSWAFLLRETLGAEVGVVGFGGQGITRNGLGGIPNMALTWDKIANGIPRAMSPAPDFIVINQGTNDDRNGVTSATFKPALTAVLNSIATATPDETKIIILLPFGGFYGAQVYRDAIAEMSRPRRAAFVDTTGWWDSTQSSDTLHPYGYANINQLSPLTAEAIRANLNSAGRHYINVGGNAVPVTARQV